MGIYSQTNAISCALFVQAPDDAPSAEWFKTTDFRITASSNGECEREAFIMHFPKLPGEPYPRRFPIIFLVPPCFKSEGLTLTVVRNDNAGSKRVAVFRIENPVPASERSEIASLPDASALSFQIAPPAR